jgi:CRP/FNR family transcriptional regulator
MEQLLAKYGTLTPLRPAEEAAFRGLALSKRSFAAGANLIAQDFDEPDQLFIVESGQLFASSLLPNGARAITRLYFSGDIVGTANIPFEHATQSISVHRPATVFVFPRSKLVQAFIDLPRGAAIFYTFAALENAILNDRLVSIGRTRGKERVAALFMEIAARRHLITRTYDQLLPVGLTQAQIGDAVGLSEVQVNRVMRELAADGVIARSGEAIEIIDYDRLRIIGQFKDRYEDLDLDWVKETS